MADKYFHCTGPRLGSRLRSKGLVEDVAAIHGEFADCLRARHYAPFTVDHDQRHLVRVAQRCKPAWIRPSISAEPGTTRYPLPTSKPYSMTNGRRFFADSKKPASHLVSAGETPAQKEGRIAGIQESIQEIRDEMNPRCLADIWRLIVPGRRDNLSAWQNDCGMPHFQWGQLCGEASAPLPGGD